MTLRDLVRDKIPYSQAIYDLSTSKFNMMKSKKLLQSVVQSGKPIQIDLGGANAGTNGWLSIDRTAECDIYWDLRLGIPFPDSSVDKVYSSHLFEHLSFDEGQALLKESFRVLKPGGTFSICVPNARIYIEHYLGLRDLPQDFFAWNPAFNNTTTIDSINYVAYMGGEHKYMFDGENLVEVLKRGGFTNARTREFDADTDKPERHHESIYAIARKN